ncbi:MAG TPA: glucose-1-phosphate thymidylyltransferase RfbA [Methanofastidiosum sp.]|nr:glucose-1-phosphate thymidylyltransferase RfbA [Methanofastidiosum sp.]
MKGIILAGGSGKRLHPITIIANKQLLPVYDKPMIYYPLSTLMIAGIKEILVITSPDYINQYLSLLGDGSKLGINIQYRIQNQPKGIAEAFILGEDFIGEDSVCLILGDNIFYGHGFSDIVQDAAKLTEGAYVFGYHVKDPQRFGIVEFDKNWNVVSVEEKPENPKSDYAVVGLYFFDNSVITFAKNVKPSKRGELEITSVIDQYLNIKKLKVKILGRGYSWIDTGSHESLVNASLYIKTIEERQGLKIGCPEEIAYTLGYITKDQLRDIAESLAGSTYGAYLKEISDE